MMFLQPKPPILWIFDYFHNKNGQNEYVLGLKLLKIIEKFQKKFPLFSKYRKFNIL